MGQRHQIFIKVNNPLKSKRVYANDTDNHTSNTPPMDVW